MIKSKCQSSCVVVELVPLKSKNPFEPHPSNKILVPFRAFFKISDEHHCHFFMRVKMENSPPPPSWVFPKVVRLSS